MVSKTFIQPVKLEFEKVGSHLHAHGVWVYVHVACSWVQQCMLPALDLVWSSFILGFDLGMMPDCIATRYHFLDAGVLPVPAHEQEAVRRVTLDQP